MIANYIFNEEEIMPPRTIDNLGMDVSTRYAEDQKILDKTLIKEAQVVTGQTQIDVTVPFFPSEVEALLHGTLLQKSWALFFPPALYFEQRKRLFTFQAVPSLGSEDKQASQVDKILAQLEMLEMKKVKERREGKGQGQQHQEQEQKEEKAVLEEEEKEKKILTTLLQTIAFIDKLCVDINSRRSQYQKG
jgi:hypothetical protein